MLHRQYPQRSRLFFSAREYETLLQKRIKSARGRWLTSMVSLQGSPNMIQRQKKESEFIWNWVCQHSLHRSEIHSVCAYTCVRTHMHAHIHTHTRMHTHTHAHTHTQTQTQRKLTWLTKMRILPLHQQQGRAFPDSPITHWDHTHSDGHVCHGVSWWVGSTYSTSNSSMMALRLSHHM